MSDPTPSFYLPSHKVLHTILHKPFSLFNLYLSLKEMITSSLFKVKLLYLMEFIQQRVLLRNIDGTTSGLDSESTKDVFLPIMNAKIVAKE